MGETSGRVIKRHHCGRIGNVRETTASEWPFLPDVGLLDDGHEVLSLKNCHECGSTLAIVVGPSPSFAEVT